MKTLQELKKAILNKNVRNNLIVFTYKDVSFIALQYVKAIAEFKELDLRFYDDFDEQFLNSDNDMFDFSSIDMLKVIVCDEFNTKVSKEELSNIKNAVVICKSVSDKLMKILKEFEMIFEIPKLQDWQIASYMKTCAPGLQDSKIKWLCSITNNDIYRLDNEIRKISCFDKEQQDDVFDMINIDNGYNDLTDIKLYDLTNAICARSFKEVDSYIKDIKAIDINAFGLVTLLRRSFKNIMNVQMDSTATAEKLGMKPLQFNIIKNKNCRKYTDEELRNIFKFLTDFDYLVKSGNFEMSDDEMIDYIICKVLS